MKPIPNSALIAKRAAAWASLLGVLIALPAVMGADTPKRLWLANGDRVLFAGPPGFEERLFTSMLETYVAASLPQHEVTFAHASELNVSEILESFYPTVIVLIGATDKSFCHDENATIELRSQRTRAWLNRAIADRSDIRVLMLLPHGCPQAEAASTVLAEAAATIKNGLAIDINLDKSGPTSGDNRLAAHARIARRVLDAWAVNPQPVRVEINAASNQVISATNASIRELRAEEWVFWSQDCHRVTLPSELKALETVTSSEEWLKVSGLKHQRYRFTVDGRYVGDFARSTFDTGLDVANTPGQAAEQGLLVFSLALERLRLWCDQQSGSQATREVFEERQAELTARLREAAKPVTHDFELQPLQ